METSTILQILQDQPRADFQFHCEGYAEPGYDDPKSGLIATGNWNPQERLERVWPIDTPDWLEFLTQEEKDKLRKVIDNTMPRIGAILEKLGVELEWEDEWYACSKCNKLFRTSPDSCSWTPSYQVGDGEIYCKDCMPGNPDNEKE